MWPESGDDTRLQPVGSYYRKRSESDIPFFKTDPALRSGLRWSRETRSFLVTGDLQDLIRVPVPHRVIPTQWSPGIHVWFSTYKSRPQMRSSHSEPAKVTFEYRLMTSSRRRSTSHSTTSTVLWTSKKKISRKQFECMRCELRHFRHTPPELKWSTAE